MARKIAIVVIFGLLLIGSMAIGYSLRRDSDVGAETQHKPQDEAVNPNNNVVAVSSRSSNASGPSVVFQATATPIAQEILNQARAVEAVFINLYQRVNPSVVNIEVSGDSTVSGIIDSSGSGFVYDKDGHIVTNAHVVLGSSEILVTFYDGSVAQAEVVGVDEYSDLAVIRVDVDPALLAPVELGDSDLLQVGQSVVAIGNPFGLRSSMTTGIISATGRTLNSQFLLNPSNVTYGNPAIIQIDASVNPGNSGGPILDLDGRVIGIATAIRSESGVFEGIAYAVPVNTIKRSVPQLIEKGVAVYPQMGIRAVPTDEPGLSIAALADELNLPARNGVLIASVISDSPAEQAGLLGGTRTVIIRGREIQVGGDLIVAVNGEAIADIDELLEYLIHKTAPGDTIILSVWRDGELVEVPLVLGER